MILCIDIGNSNIVLGTVKDGKVLSTYRLVTDDKMTADEYYHKLKQFVNNEEIEGVALSSVVPALDLVFKELCRKYYHLKPFVVGPGIKSGLKLKIEEPKSLGSDLLCDAVGAFCKYHKDSIIIDLGTANKLVIVNKKGEYLGGMIAPGIIGSLNSLISNAAKLSYTTIEVPPHVVGNNTATCIQSGIVYGTASMIDGMVQRSVEELGFSDYEVILTGGLSVVVKDVLRTKCHFEPNILIEGLYELYSKNKEIN